MNLPKEIDGENPNLSVIHNEETGGGNRQPAPASQPQKRLAHVDIARGLAILLVVVGHGWLVLHDPTELYRVIYSFHIPLFLLLSGVFFDAALPFWRMVRTRADALLKPYFVTLLAVAILQSWMDGNTAALPESIPAIFYGNARLPVWMPLWFLPHLFLLSVAAWLILGILQVKKWRPLFQAALLLGGLAVGVLTLRWAWPLALPGTSLRGLPFSADLLPVTAFYFLLGYLLRAQIKGPLSQPPVWTALALAVFLGLHLTRNDSLDLNLRRYDGLVVSTLQALTGSYLVLAFSRALAGFQVPARLLGYLGRNSLLILIFHNPIQRSLFSLLSDLLGSHTAASLLSSALAVLACLLIAESVQRIPALRMLYLPAAAGKRTG